MAECSDRPPDAVDILERPTAIRVLSLAAAVVVFILESAAVNRPAGSHPLPATRAYNMLVDQTIHALYEFAEISETGEVVFKDREGIDIREEFKRLARPSIGHFLFDAKFLAAYLDSPHLFLETKEHPIRGRLANYEAAVILRDLVVEFLGKALERTFESAAAKARDQLKPWLEDLRRVCPRQVAEETMEVVLLFRSKREDMLAALVTELCRSSSEWIFASLGTAPERELQGPLFCLDVKADLSEEEACSGIATQIAAALDKLLQPRGEEDEVEVDIGTAMIKVPSSPNPRLEMEVALSNLRSWMV